MQTQWPLRWLFLLLVASCPLSRAQASDFDERPVPVKAVAPKYPEEMRREKITGIVTLRLVVDENGDVIEKSVTKSTRSDFDGAALAAIDQWKFKPARKGGAAVRATITLPIKFTIES